MMEYVHVVGEIHKSEGGILQNVKMNLFFVTTVVFPSKNKIIYLLSKEKGIYRTSVSDVTCYFWDGQGGAGTMEGENQRLAMA